VALIGVSIATWISTRLAQPVRALAEGARRIAAGEHIPPIHVDTDDEIALLADEFNTMNREVNTLSRTLEQKVIERTAQLEEKNQQLLNAQKELAKAERLAGLGLLAAGVAHEINNPLAVIRGNAELLQMALPEEAAEREEVGEILQEAGRIERIVGNLRVFSKRENLQPHTFKLELLLNGILNQIGHQVALGLYQIDRRYIGCGITLKGDEERLRQVFTNLILNGLQAMPEGGKLTMDAAVVDKGRRVSIVVTDNGCGISAHNIEKLFTPFFTTKARGTGLGLAVSYGIVSDHGGDIRVESREGEGAGFTVLLPLGES
jgi:two-component system NtrC family sensor kinase